VRHQISHPGKQQVKWCCNFVHFNLWVSRQCKEKTNLQNSVASTILRIDLLECSSRFQIFQLCHIFKGLIMSLFYIPVTTHTHKLRFLYVYFQTNLLTRV
jgi:hypothetical protein